MEKDTWKDGIYSYEVSFSDYFPTFILTQFVSAVGALTFLLWLAPAKFDEWSLIKIVVFGLAVSAFISVLVYYSFKRHMESKKSKIKKMYLVDIMNHFIPAYFEPNVLRVMADWREKQVISSNVDLLRSQILAYAKMYRLAGNTLQAVNEDLKSMIKDVEGKNFGDVKYYPETLNLTVNGDWNISIKIGGKLIEEEEEDE